MPRPSAAEALYPHLPRRTDDVAKWAQQAPQTMAEAVYSRPKLKPTNPDRESLLRLLKRANANLEARKR